MVKRSEYLHGYVYLIKRVNAHQKAGQELKLAIKNAIIDTKNAGLIVDFLVSHESEVINILVYEFDMNKAAAVWRKEESTLTRQEDQKAFALKLFKRNRPIDEIVEDTELSLAEVLSIKKELEGK